MKRMEIAQKLKVCISLSGLSLIATVISKNAIFFKISHITDISECDCLPFDTQDEQK